MTIATISGGRDVVSVGADRPVREVVALLAQHRIGAVPVLVEGQVAGIFSERDMIHALVEVGAGALDMAVGERMTSPAITVTPQVSVLGALSLMTQRRIRHLPVVEDERLVGFVSIGDLVKHRIDGIEAEARAMRDYIQQA
ncbi:CBS domain-containing protein [Sphingomonas sp. 2R-10]|uniref:CBS domain-containing protein n=1 Tax=Sphingomonas sp. 2R-10 TaxID=3045148 RepID=UPI000F76805B|nr:CBS domain-containing protein [Sphingomonas sp. 2R-10]MDJ0278406.1 CBS domain-containing protein [Sphingomonas sp. 2R-10]